MEKPINLDFKSGKITGARLIESIGIFLFRLGAKLTGRYQFYGFSYGSKFVRAILPSARMIQVDMGQGRIFAFPYGDAYWGRLFDNSQSYEYDVQKFLKIVADSDHAFIDCGANFGFMSVLASSPVAGSCPTIAIEADYNNYKLLTHNCELNEKRFEIRHNAIFSESGKEVSVYGEKHEAFTIVEDEGEFRGKVTTLSIGDLSGWLKSTGKSRAVIKLDVEGAEIPAIDGIGDLGGAEIVLIYEDHGSDLQHSVTRHLKEQLGYRVFSFDGEFMKEIVDYSMLDAIKTNRRYGYDLVATKSPFWLGKVTGLIN